MSHKIELNRESSTAQLVVTITSNTVIDAVRNYLTSNVPEVVTFHSAHTPYETNVHFEEDGSVRITFTKTEVDDI
jgi:hypothetical protein